MTEKNPLYFSLIEACRQPGCPLCRVAQDAVERYLDHLFYADVNDIKVRQHLRESRGFCPPHAWLLLEKKLGDALGIAIIYHDILTNILRDMPSPYPPAEQAAAPGFLARLSGSLSKALKSASQALSPRRPCPACAEQEGMERLLGGVLVDALTDAAMTEALQASDGLCLIHLRQACERVNDPQAFSRLLAFSREHIQNLDAELVEYIRKNDYRFRKEELGPEGDSWQRVIMMAAGTRKKV